MSDISGYVVKTKTSGLERVLYIVRIGYETAENAS